MLTNRGGQVTYHGPGQVVAYPLIDLKRAGYYVKEYVFRIEESVIKTLAHFGVTGHRVRGAPGIYVRLNDPNSHARLPADFTSQQLGSDPNCFLGKIAALGIKVSRHCTYHGVALNVAMDLDPFTRINPCGYAGLATTDLVHMGVQVSWEDEALAASFPSMWLYEYTLARRVAPELQIRRWLNAATLQPRRDFGWLAYSALKSEPPARLRWLTRLLQDGIAFLGGVPQLENAILEAMAHVGRVLETNYGRLFDVRTVAQPENLAFSDLGLGLHTDNPYREPVPGFQALHTLVAAPDGGDSLFADGYALGEHLRASDPEAFELLTRTPVPFRYCSVGVELYAERPLIELTCTGAIAAIAYNNRSIRPLRLAPAECARFYAAYRRFAELLHDPRYQLPTRLKDGDLVVFDNRRVLHGRTAFISARHRRHLQGCYLTRDSVYSEAAVLRAQLDNGAPA